MHNALAAFVFDQPVHSFWALLGTSFFFAYFATKSTYHEKTIPYFIGNPYSLAS